MRFQLFAVVLGLSQLIAAQPPPNNNGNGIPTCAMGCFETAIENSGCAINDYYCQCTGQGRQNILSSVTNCLCRGSCSQNDLTYAQSAANRVCKNALAASGQPYAATTYGLTACGLASPATATWNGASTNSPTLLGCQAILGLAGLAVLVV